MVRDFLRAEGWEVVELGPSTPAGALADLVDAERPDVVALSTATAAHLADARDAVTRLAALDPQPFIAVGGQAWERDRAPEGADLLIADLEALIDELRRALPAPRRLTGYRSCIANKPALGVAVQDLTPLFRAGRSR